jgi:hypothetical protein
MGLSANLHLLMEALPTYRISIDTAEYNNDARWVRVLFIVLCGPAG